MIARPAENPSAFISYAHEDRAIANELALGLERRGCRVWIDHGEMRVGDSLVDRLASGIAEVDIVIPIVSEHSVRSSWCSKELSLAMTDEINLADRFGVRRVMPLRVGEVSMPPALRDKFYLDISRTAPGTIVPKLWEDIAGPQGLTLSAGPQTKTEADLSYERGRNLYDKGEVAAARRHLHSASQQSHHRAALLLGEILGDEGKFESAADELQFAVGSEDPDVATTAVIAHGRLIAMAEAAEDAQLDGRNGVWMSRDVAQATKLWRAAGESGDHNAAWAWLGLGLLSQDPLDPDAKVDLVGAEAAFERAARSGHSESHTYALLKLGLLKLRMGNTEEAIAVLGVGATARDPEWGPRCAFHLGSVHWAEHEDEEAGRWWYEASVSGHPRIGLLAQEAIDDPNSIWRSRQ
jgi:TPR repeat protein